jgi:hypothetical protein
MERSVFRSSMISKLIARLFICLVFIQTLTLASQDHRRSDFARDDADASIASGSICETPPASDRDAPIHSACDPCISCLIASHSALPVSAAARIIVVLSLRSEKGSIPGIFDAPAPPPEGWASSWSSRAPPAFS